MTDRGLSTVIGYVLVLGIITLLLTGLVTSFGPLVAQQQSAASQSNFQTVGADLAGAIETADRLATTSDDPDVTVRMDLPDRVGETQYMITIESDGEKYRISVHAGEETLATTYVRTETSLDLSTSHRLDGGAVAITLDNQQLVIENA